LTAVDWEALFDRPILLVSGKGGTGKSTVAAALALAASRSGRHVLLVETEGRHEIARSLGIPDPGFAERQTPWGFHALAVTPKEAVREYLTIYFGMDRVSRALVRTGILDQMVGLIPGFRDLLLGGKIFEIEHVRVSNPRDAGRPEYDLVVVDAPPTGQIASFLASPGTFAELIKVGRMKRQAAGIDRMLRERARLILATLLDEMAVTETLEAVEHVAAARMPATAVVANRVLAEVVPKGSRRAFDRLAPERLEALASEAGASVDSAIAAELLRGARASDERRRTQIAYLDQLRASRLPVFELPDVPGTAEEWPAQRIAALAATIGHEPASAIPLPRRPAPTIAKTKKRRPPATVSPGDLGPYLRGTRIVVVCGSGGVGKTTISAAVAVRTALAGRETALLTVDPARRLATALRLPDVAGERTIVDLGAGRRLEALQLDTQRTFDDLIARYATSPERRDRILHNAFYRRLADTLAGTHEYMAMEKLYELAAEEQHEAIVIDTPPTRSALSFLDAPNRMTDFLGGRLLRWMLWPSARAGRLGLSVARMGATAFARTAGRMVGAEVLADIADFLTAFEGLYGGFKDRAAKVLELLRSPECAYVVVTAPTPQSLEEAGFFVQRLAEGGMRAAAVVVNRWHQEAGPLPAGTARAAATLEGTGEAASKAAGAVLADRVRREPVRMNEARAITGFASAFRTVAIVTVPELAGDVQDVPGLRRVADRLFAPADGP
jgi:anion-transporting  ArsA/GET3 family ATPase